MWNNYIIFAQKYCKFHYFVNVGCLFIHVRLKIQLRLKILFSTSFDITWYAETAMHAKNLLLSHSIVSKWSVTKLNDVKNAIMQETYFLNGPILNLLFYCHIILCWEKVTSYEKFSQILPLKSKLSRKIQRFDVKDGSIEMLKNNWISKIFN